MGRNLTKEQRRLAERKAWKLRAQCWSLARIADELEVDLGRTITPQGVYALLVRVEKRATKRMTDEVVAEKRAKLHQLDHLLHEAIDAWEKSKGPKKRAVKITKGGEVINQVTVEEREGNPAYLDRALAVIVQVRELLGLDPEEGTMSGADPSALLEDARRILNDRRERLRALPAPDGNLGGVP